MNTLIYGAIFLLLLVALIISLRQMSWALDDADIEQFSIWTGIASIIATIPMVLW